MASRVDGEFAIKVCLVLLRVYTTSKVKKTCIFFKSSIQFRIFICLSARFCFCGDCWLVSLFASNVKLSGMLILGGEKQT